MSGRSPSGRVTLGDVARLAGVSPATASKVLNGRSDVSEHTRDRVLSVIAESGYRPTTTRQAPQRPRALLAVFDGLDTLYTSTVLMGILSATSVGHVDLLVRFVPSAPKANRPPTDRPWVEEQFDIGLRGIESPLSAVTARTWVDAQLTSEVDGIVVIASGLPETVIHAAEERSLPIVAIDPVDTLDSRVVSVGSTNWAGGRSATDHLISLGHRRIAWIGGPSGSAASAERFHGFQSAMDSAGLTVDPVFVTNGTFSVGTGFEYAKGYLSHVDPPTAIVSANDEIAVGVLAAARELGVAVPAALSVTGFDDTPQTMWTTPRLTSVRQPLVGMGRMAAETALMMAAGGTPASRHVQLATSLRVRDSTAPVPRR